MNVKETEQRIRELLAERNYYRLDYEGEWLDKVFAAYCQPHRYFHTLQHLLNICESIRKESWDDEIMAAQLLITALFHDVVWYPQDPRALGMADGALESGRLFLLREKENLGYARGNNLGVDYLLRRFPDIDLFLITNDDIQFISSNVVDKLIEKISSFSDVAVIGPRIVNLQDEEQLPELTPP